MNISSLFFAFIKNCSYLCRDISAKNELKIVNYEKITMCGCTTDSLGHKFTGPTKDTGRGAYQGRSAG
jgi:hypothetical protein